MSFTVLSVAYPFAPVGPDAVGGAEQVLGQIDQALATNGHKSLVLASERSTTAGSLIPIAAVTGALNKSVRDRVYEQVRSAMRQILTQSRVDLVHMHGVDFHEYLPEPGVPVLATLHLPPTWYPPEVFRLDRPQTFLQCVSATQRHACPPSSQLVPEVENGVPVEALSEKRHAKRNFAFALGRICPEKGFHLALEAATRAQTPLLLAGEVFRYEAHEQYFQREIVPRLDGLRRFIGPAGFRRKRRLLAAARCLLVPSLVAETSSLVAMEALACGTPVVAFPAGALAEIVEHGRTGFLVTDEKAMADAIRAVDALDPQECRRSARERFSRDRMVKGYLRLYEQLLAGEVPVTVHSSKSAPAASWPTFAELAPAAPLSGLDQSVRSQPHRVGALDIYEVSSAAALGALRPEWRRLWESDRQATPFQSPAWLIPWWKHLGWGDLGTLAVRREQRLVGLLPAFRERDGGSGKLLLMGTGISDYLGVLADPRYRAEVSAALYAYLGARLDVWQTCDWQQLRPASPLLDVPSGFVSHRAVQEVCPVLELQPGSARLTREIPSRQAEKLRYYWRRAAKLGPVQVDRASPETFHESFNVLLRLHQARWRSAGSAGVLAHDAVQRFHREAAAELLTLGLLRLYALRINSRPVAALYALSHNQTCYYYIGGFDPEFAAISPGTLLVGHALTQAEAEAAERFDFLRGRESYKYHWGAKDSITYRLEIRPGKPS